MTSGEDVDFQRLFQDEVLRWSYFDAPDQLLVLHLAKNGGTTFLAEFFRWEGADLEGLVESVAHPEIAWDQGLWSCASRLSGLFDNLPEETQEYALNSPSVRRIAFVREPLDRLWSAWVSKILMAEPPWAPHRDATLGPFSSYRFDEGSGPEAVADMFSVFVSYLWESEDLRADAHFMPQAQQLTARPPDTAIHDLGQLDAVMVERAGERWSRRARRLNVSRALVPGPICTPDTYQAVRELYHADYTAFGGLWAEDYQQGWDPRAPRNWPRSNDSALMHMRAARRLTRHVEHEDELERDRTRLQRNVEDLQHDLQQLGREHREQRQALERLRAAIASLEDERTSLQDAHAQVLAALAECRRSLRAVQSSRLYRLLHPVWRVAAVGRRRLSRDR